MMQKLSQLSYCSFEKYPLWLLLIFLHIYLFIFQRASVITCHLWVCFCEQPVFFLSFFIGQDAELSGTLSLVLTQCCKRIKDTVQKLASDHKDIHSSVSRVGKAIDKVWSCLECLVCSSIIHHFPWLLSSHQLSHCLYYFFHPCFQLCGFTVVLLKFRVAVISKNTNKSKPETSFYSLFFKNPFSCMMTTPSVKVSQFPNF